MGDGLDSRIKNQTRATIEKLKSWGAQIEEISMPLLVEMVPVYYVLMPAEASTNLARLDGLRYGQQSDTFSFDSLQAYYEHIRTDGFLEETKRRILLGTYVLSSENYEGYYIKAKRVQKKMQQNMEKVFATYDAIIMPIMPDVAREVGSEKSKDPVKNYLADIYTIPANLCHICAMSVPNGFVEDAGEQMPVGIQIMANKRKENILFGIGGVIEKIK